MKRFVLLMSVVSVVVSGVSADACEHCRAKAAALAAASGKTQDGEVVWTAERRIADPVGYSVYAVERAGKELQLRIAARKRLQQTYAQVEEKQGELQEELCKVESDLDVVRCHLQRECYPVEVSGTCIRDEVQARRVTGGLLARQRAIAEAIAVMDQELSAGAHEVDQIVAQIGQLELEIGMSEYRLTRIVSSSLPEDSVQLMAQFHGMLPGKTTEIALHEVRVEAFLNTVVRDVDGDGGQRADVGGENVVR